MLKIDRLKLEYIVVGTGRCGTVYMARLLTSLGIMCGHEAIFDFNGIETARNKIAKKVPIKTSKCSNVDLMAEQSLEDWFDSVDVKAESSYMAAPFLDDNCIKSAKIIHVVRHPLSVISSFVKDVYFFEYPNNEVLKNEQGNYQAFVLSVLPQLLEIETAIERACYYYVEWNKIIEEFKNKQYILHHVEDGYSDALKSFINIDKSNYFQNIKINSWKRRIQDLTLNDIPDGVIKDNFIEYSHHIGYLI